MRSLKVLDLYNNNLFGTIPGKPLLDSVSKPLCNLEGTAPTKRTFQNSSKVSIFGNRNLCGGIPELQLKPGSVNRHWHHGRCEFSFVFNNDTELQRFCNIIHAFAVLSFVLQWWVILAFLLSLLWISVILASYDYAVIF